MLESERAHLYSVSYLQTAGSVNAATVERRDFAAAGFITKVGRTLGELVGAFVLSLTVVAVVALGIFSGFGAVLLILQAFAPPNPTASGKPSLVANQAHAAHAGSN
jgi:hypothetical protein